MLRDLLEGSGTLDIISLTLSEEKLQHDALLRLEVLVVRQPDLAVTIVRALIHKKGHHFLREMRKIIINNRLH